MDEEGLLRYNCFRGLSTNKFICFCLRWLKTVPGLSKTQILMGHNCHSLSIDATIMVSKTAPSLMNTLVLFS